nr:hypothetical protein Iba_chr05eCG13960 [Ipomoea batatas]
MAKLSCRDESILILVKNSERLLQLLLRITGERNQTIAVLIEEAEGFLELGDLIVGQLIRHFSLQKLRTERRRGAEGEAVLESGEWMNREVPECPLLASPNKNAEPTRFSTFLLPPANTAAGKSPAREIRRLHVRNLSAHLQIPKQNQTPYVCNCREKSRSATGAPAWSLGGKCKKNSTVRIGGAADGVGGEEVLAGRRNVDGSEEKDAVKGVRQVQPRLGSA